MKAIWTTIQQMLNYTFSNRPDSQKEEVENLLESKEPLSTGDLQKIYDTFKSNGIHIEVASNGLIHNDAYFDLKDIKTSFSGESIAALINFGSRQAQNGNLDYTGFIVNSHSQSLLTDSIIRSQNLHVTLVRFVHKSQVNPKGLNAFKNFIQTGIPITSSNSPSLNVRYRENEEESQNDVRNWTFELGPNGNVGLYDVHSLDKISKNEDLFKDFVDDISHNEESLDIAVVVVCSLDKLNSEFQQHWIQKLKEQSCIPISSMIECPLREIVINLSLRNGCRIMHQLLNNLLEPTLYSPTLDLDSFDSLQFGKPFITKKEDMDIIQYGDFSNWSGTEGYVNHFVGSTCLSEVPNTCIIHISPYHGFVSVIDKDVPEGEESSILSTLSKTGSFPLGLTSNIQQMTHYLLYTENIQESKENSLALDPHHMKIQKRLTDRFFGSISLETLPTHEYVYDILKYYLDKVASLKSYHKPKIQYYKPIYCKFD